MLQTRIVVTFGGIALYSSRRQPYVRSPRIEMNSVASCGVHARLIVAEFEDGAAAAAASAVALTSRKQRGYV
jgi:hypothetical protein